MNARRTLLAVALATPFACDPSAPDADAIARGSEDAPVVETSDDAPEAVAPAREPDAVDPAANAP
ncbi:MAG TPA: hypothetical protein VG755_14280, partial [Nannocystaceae bacterium]|nr:hypothetical protein [Nannocystaceae bacterium]